MSPRRRWVRNADAVKHCSQACRRRGLTAVDEALERAILGLLAARPSGASLCPSEAARAVAGTATPGAEPDEARWRSLMEPARRAARRLVWAGGVEITQGGRVVEPSTARGPIRVRRRRIPT